MPPMVPVYFQASQWLRGYLQKPFYANGYDASRAARYANGILGGLKNPPAAPIVKLGVMGGEPPGLNLGYIPNGPGGWVQGQGNLLLTSCGYPGFSGDQAGKNNGQTRYATWQHAFAQLFASDPDFQRAARYPLFSIIDTDSAHHLSAPLVERAVAYADAPRLVGEPGRAMLVVNFDAHTDYGAQARDTSTPITCQSWGRFVSNTVPQVHGYQLADAYVRFGLNTALDSTPTWSHGEWHQANTDTVTQRIAETDNASLADQLDTVIDAITQHGTRGLNAYVSIDRDVVQVNYTQYSDGPFPADQGIAGVKTCLDHLVSKGASIVGFDVCGLPTFPGETRIKTRELPIPEAMALAQAQVTTLWDYLSG
ncbi:MAG: arginase family protein [Nocardiopsaceae bacterium]|nr:arginase family protein [Nocardiopsaceae bacterium]